MNVLFSSVLIIAIFVIWIYLYNRKLEINRKKSIDDEIKYWLEKFKLNGFTLQTLINTKRFPSQIIDILEKNLVHILFQHFLQMNLESNIMRIYQMKYLVRYLSIKNISN